jgi:DNA-directed RNA polymerase specialized sigma24 family protein
MLNQPTSARPVTCASPPTRRSDNELVRLLEGHRRELRTHCRRILGSAFEADDAVQETLVHLDACSATNPQERPTQQEPT